LQSTTSSTVPGCEPLTPPNASTCPKLVPSNVPENAALSPVVTFGATIESSTPPGAENSTTLAMACCPVGHPDVVAHVN